MLAGLVGRSESWLSQVERGKRGVDSHAVLTRMAAVLRVEVEELTGPDGGGEEGQRVYEPAAQIEQAMMRYDAAAASIGGREPRARGSAEHLRAMARAAYQGYQATRYDDTGRVLPALISEAEAASRAAGLDNPRDVRGARPGLRHRRRAAQPGRARRRWRGWRPTGRWRRPSSPGSRHWRQLARGGCPT